jgi:hypothetical protein
MDGVQEPHAIAPFLAMAIKLGDSIAADLDEEEEATLEYARTLTSRLYGEIGWAFEQMAVTVREGDQLHREADVPVEFEVEVHGADLREIGMVRDVIGERLLWHLQRAGLECIDEEEGEEEEDVEEGEEEGTETQYG